MISEKINRKVLQSLLEQNWNRFNDWYWSADDYDQNIAELIEERLTMFDGETIKDMQRNINAVLATSKHLLPFDKREIEWFQYCIGRLRHVRGGIKN